MPDPGGIGGCEGGIDASRGKMWASRRNTAHPGEGGEGMHG